ncbi:MAG TPA: hypothetical protein VH482_03650 [Thermomicrobiales bacterium]
MRGESTERAGDSADGVNGDHGDALVLIDGRHELRVKWLAKQLAIPFHPFDDPIGQGTAGECDHGGLTGLETLADLTQCVAARIVVEVAAGDPAEPRPDDGTGQRASRQFLPAGEVVLLLACDVPGKILRDQGGTVEFDLVLLLHPRERLDGCLGRHAVDNNGENQMGVRGIHARSVLFRHAPTV